ncbi:Ig-like domain-containing protein, partial [Klebsiella aerogenes]|uniref:Ig-like domain-containing protein n=1 Tax=Klebsiella aerogenes TaxID=548 RepID=UPI000E2E4581
TFNIVAGDDIVNIAEHGQALIVTGKVTGAQAGDVITLTLNGKDYTTTVSADGSWTLNVPAADLAGLTDGSVTVTAAVSDKAGNPASVDHNLTVDVTVPAVTIHTVAGDD